MTTDTLTALYTAQNEAANQLAEILANPKPSYHVGNRSVSWNEYQTMLTQQIKDLQEVIISFSPYIQTIRQYL